MLKHHTCTGASVPAFFLVPALLFSFFFNGQNFYAFLGTQICLLLALAGVLYFTYSGKEEIELSAVIILLSVLALWLFITILWSRIPYLSIVNAWWLSSAALACWIFVLAPRKEALYTAVLGAAFMAGGFQGFLALYQVYVLGTLPNGLFLYKNLLGAFLALQAFIVSGLFIRLPEEKRRTRYLLITFLLFLTFLVGFTQSRGGILSFSLAMLLFFTIAHYLKADRRPLVILLATLVLAFACAELVTRVGVSGVPVASQRMMSLQHPFAAGAGRFIIWQGCLEMIRACPLWGTGLGTFWFLWPPYRSPQDAGGGYYAHNDYLQLWIEGGLPLIILLAGLLFAVVISFYRTIKAKDLPQANKIEALALFAGLMGLAIHTFFDFNFYIMPTMILAGVMLGRLDVFSAARKWRLVLPEFLKVRSSVYRTCLLSAVLAVLVSFGFMGFSYCYTVKGIEQIALKQYVDASRSFEIAGKLWNSYDKPLYSHAYLLGSVVKPAGGDESSREERRQVYDQALGYLLRAERRNPYRPEIYVIRGLLEESMGAEATEVIAAFEKALQIDPWFLHGRTEYGRYLASIGRSKEALAILEKGTVYAYHPEDAKLMPYYQLTAILRRYHGDLTGAETLEEKIAVLKKKSQRDRSTKKWEWLF
jgi:O-antigen ligase